MREHAPHHSVSEQAPRRSVREHAPRRSVSGASERAANEVAEALQAEVKELRQQLATMKAKKEHSNRAEPSREPSRELRRGKSHEDRGELQRVRVGGFEMLSSAGLGEGSAGPANAEGDGEALTLRLRVLNGGRHPQAVWEPRTPAAANTGSSLQGGRAATNQEPPVPDAAPSGGAPGSAQEPASADPETMTEEQAPCAVSPCPHVPPRRALFAVHGRPLVSVWPKRWEAAG